MTPSGLERTLRRMPTASGAQLKTIQRELKDAVGERWYDAEIHARVKSSCALYGLTAPQWVQRHLDIGETWLLLYEGTSGAGTTAVLRAKLDATTRETAFGAEAQDEARQALSGLVAALAAKGRCLPHPTFRYRLSAESTTVNAAISGGSLGVATCVAVVSAALGAAARANVAATACVHPDGTLKPVAFLREKLEALRRHQPGVDTVIVAGDQDVGSLHGFQFIRCNDVIEALTQFGLDITALPGTDLDNACARVQTFARDDANATSVERWEELAAEALFTYRVLKNAGQDCAEDCAKALGFWILFSAHAGHAGDVGELRKEVETLSASVHPEQAALVRVFLASWEIDRAPESAVGSAWQALEAARNLADSRRVLGRAMGTYGRALLHGGRAVEAIAFLQDAVDAHEHDEPREVPRSLSYLGAALRMAGHAERALETLQEGLKGAATASLRGPAEKTSTYLQLERGRALLELHRPSNALAAFEVAARGCEYDYEHPRSAALRGMAAAYRQLGMVEQERDMYSRCLSVARGNSVQIFRQVAAMAIADKWVEQDVTGDERAVWQELFPQRAERAAALRCRERWVY